MTARAKIVRSLTSGVMAGLLLVGVTSCSGDEAGGQNDPGAADSSAASPGAGATAESPSPPPEDLPTDDPTIETSDGGEVSTSGDLPEDYPAEAVPVIDGTVLSAASAEGGYNLVILAKQKPKKAAAAALELLTGKGFSVEKRRAKKGSVVAVLRSADYRVEVAATKAGMDTSVNYFVTPR